MGKRLTDANRLSLRNPEVSAEWDHTKNGELTPHDVSYGCNDKAWWVCRTCHHPWEAVIADRTRGRGARGCPSCAGTIVTDANRLSLRNPDVAAEWHPTKNGTLTPDGVSYVSHKKVWWLCKNVHDWEAAVADRVVSGNGCRKCTLPHRSKVEVRLACELASFFSDVDPQQTHPVTTSEGGTLEVDVLIPSQKLVIEYDAAYWHEDKLDQDREKTELLKAAEWEVLRIRERPLALIQPSDLQVPVTYPNDVKRLTDSVLVHLREAFGVEIPDLDEYLNSDSLVKEGLAKEILGRRQ